MLLLRDFLLEITSSIQKGCDPWRERSLIMSVTFICAVDFSSKYSVMRAQIDD